MILWQRFLIFPKLAVICWSPTSNCHLLHQFTMVKFKKKTLLKLSKGRLQIMNFSTLEKNQQFQPNILPFKTYILVWFPSKNIDKILAHEALKDKKLMDVMGFSNWLELIYYKLQVSISNAVLFLVQIGHFSLILTLIYKLNKALDTLLLKFQIYIWLALWNSWEKI